MRKDRGSCQRRWGRRRQVGLIGLLSVCTGLLGCGPRSFEYTGSDAALADAGQIAEAGPRDAAVAERAIGLPDHSSSQDSHLNLPDATRPDTGVPDTAVPDTNQLTPDAAIGSDSAPAICEQPRKGGSSGSLFVINGTREPTLLPLSAAQKRAAVALATPWDGSFCTGTLIANQVVLTAEHCNPDAPGLGSVTVQFSANGVTLDLELGVSNFYRHSSADLGVYILAGDPTASIAVTPVPILPTDLDSSWVGTRVEAAGWGQVDLAGNHDGRYFVAEPIYQITSTEVVVNGEGIHGLCRGDSGGPVFGLISGEIRTLGNLSWGDSSCTGLDHYIRADVFRSYIEQYAGTTPPLNGGGGCGSVTATGYCQSSNSQAVYCQDNVVQQDDCASQSLVCGYSASASGYRCIANSVDPCQGLDGLGECVGATVRWCASGAIRSFDCAQCGWGCGWVSASVGYDCAEGGAPTDPCAGHANCSGIGYQGTCSGDTLFWCEPDNAGVCQLWELDCASNSLSCAWYNDQYGYACY